ncbi:acetylcholine receptor subunit alpha-1-B-like [Crassostrea virginica]
MITTIFQWTIVTFVLTVVFANRTSMESLYTDLLRDYNPHIRPNDDQTQRTVISVTMHLISINEIEELTGVMSTVVNVDVMWRDPRMTWNKTKYIDVTDILFPQELVWKPDLVVTNPAKKVRKIGFEDIMIRYNNNGIAYWYTGDYLETSCDIDVTHFPFDRQVCTIVMIPWNYRQNELTMSIAQNNVQMENFTANGEWILYKTTAERVGDRPYEYIYFNLYLERRSSFFIINLFVPVVLLVFLNCMVFFLSPDSGERVGYAITCLLAITVYMTLVSETIPKTSKPICILSIVLLVLLMVSTVICFLTIISLNFHFRSKQKPLPEWLAKITRALRCANIKRRCGNNPRSDRRERKETSTETSQSQTDVESSKTQSIEDSEHTSNGKSVHLEKESENCHEPQDHDLETWKTFAILFDHYCFLFCCISLLIGSLYFVIFTNIM